MERVVKYEMNSAKSSNQGNHPNARITVVVDFGTDWDNVVVDEVCARRHLIFGMLTQTLDIEEARNYDIYF